MAKEKQYYTEEFGFYPNTPEKTILKHLSSVIADKELHSLTGIGNMIIAMQVPVWPKTIGGRDIRYFEQLKKGHYNVNFKSGIIVSKDVIEMSYHNIPNSKDLVGSDFVTLPKQFLVIGSEKDKSLEGKIIFLKPSVVDVVSFYYEGEVLSGLFYDQILMKKNN